MDPLEPKVNYHALGAVRTKPGRGDPTLSLSCSDKMSKWCQVGFQGSLLSAFFQKPLLPHIILMGGTKQASLDSLHRSLFGRFGFQSDNIKLCKSEQDFDEKQVQYDAEKLQEWPGFNTDPPKGTQDESRYYRLLINGYNQF